MFLRTLYLRNFRCYEEAEFHFSPGVNLIHGPNAQGKTSILEAVHFLSTGQSFRTSQIKDLIRIGASSFYLEAVFEKHGIEQTLKVTSDAQERRILYNNTVCSSTTSLWGLLQGVTLTPDDIEVVKGGPQLRRQFLDMQIAQADPLYVHHLTRYNRGLRQRNILLRARKTASIEIWEQEMSKSAAYLVQQRMRAAMELQVTSGDLYQMIGSEKCRLELRYNGPQAGTSPLHVSYLEQWQKMRQRELEIGYTLVGPHRDDCFIALDGREVRFFASEGQQRTCVAAMRLAEWNRLRTLVEEAPLMLMDDVGMGLDSVRRERLLISAQGLGQVFLTTTQKFDFQDGREVTSISLPIN